MARNHLFQPGEDEPVEDNLFVEPADQPTHHQDEDELSRARSYEVVQAYLG